MKKIIKISQQTFWQVLGKVVTSLSTLVILSVVARQYGETGTGVYTLALTYLAIFYLLSDFGFNAHVLRKVIGNSLQVTNEWNKLLGTRVMWSVVLVIVAVGTLLFWPFATREFSLAVLFGSLAIIGSGVFVTCNLIFQNKLRYDLSVLASSLGTLISLGVFGYLVFFKYPIPLMLLAHLVGWFFIAAVALILVRKILKSIYPIYQIPYTINLFKESWPIAVTLGLNVVYFRVDAFILSYFHGVSQVGIYNVAYSIFQTILVLPIFVMNSFYPMMLNTLKVNVEKFVSHIKLAALVLSLMAICIAFITYYLSPFMIGIITGQGFEGSALSLQILSFGLPAYFLSALLMWVMVAKKMYIKLFMVYGIGLMVNLILNLVFTPQLSYIAASWITGICEYLILIFQILILYSSK